MARETPNTRKRRRARGTGAPDVACAAARSLPGYGLPFPRHRQFETCFTGADGGPIAPECGPGNFDADGDVDCVDGEQFSLVWTQAGDPSVLSGCAAVPGPVAGLLLSAVGVNFANLRME